MQEEFCRTQLTGAKYRRLGKQDGSSGTRKSADNKQQDRQRRLADSVVICCVVVKSGPAATN